MRQDIIDKLLQDKLEEARQTGVAEGRKLTLFEVVKNMSHQGCALELISQVTHLSISDIKCLLD